MDLATKVLKKLYKILIKYWLSFICLFVFTYQTSLLLIEYLSGNTVVSIKVGQINNETLPAITICLPASLSIKRLAQINDEFAETYSNYTRYLNVLKSDNKKDKNNELVEIYGKAIELFNDKLANISVLEILTNYSLPRDGMGLYIESFINKKDKPNFNMIESMENNFSIIGSLTYTTFNIEKCFTLFSHLNKYERVVKYNSPTILIFLKGSYNWFPPNIIAKRDIKLYIHSANSLPEYEEPTDYLSLNQISFITYNQITTELLGKGFDTNCFEYDLDYKFANFNMRSDCISTCIQSYLSQDCNDTGLARSLTLLREDLLGQEELRNKSFSTRRKNIGCMLEYSLDAKVSCKSQCQPDCNFRYYSTKVFTYEDQDLDDSYDDDFGFIIIIQHNSMPDILLTYLPQTTFLSSVCNFGGLLGMWLGLSFLNIFNKLFSLLNQTIKNKLIIRNNQLNNFTNNNYYMNFIIPRDRHQSRISIP